MIPGPIFADSDQTLGFQSCDPLARGWGAHDSGLLGMLFRSTVPPPSPVELMAGVTLIQFSKCVLFGLSGAMAGHLGSRFMLRLRHSSRHSGRC